MASRVDETQVSDGRATTADSGPRGLLSPDLAPGDAIGDYRIAARIGQGGMGIVYGAVHARLGQRVAIKVLDEARCTQPEAVARFAREARAVNQIRHPNIVDILAFGNLSDGRSYFAMAWLDGQSLAARLRAGRPSLAESCAILEEVALALEAAHAQRIVHRDLKPDNIYLGGGGDRPKVTLLDFGIAKLLDDDDEARASLTRTGSLIGTPLYVSPEQARGGAIDTRADIYALGAVAFEMITGAPPFVSGSTMEVVARHLYDTPPRAARTVPGLPRTLDALLARMLAKEPDERPTLAELRAVLQQVRAAADRAEAAAVRRLDRALWLAATAIVGLTAAIAACAT